MLCRACHKADVHYIESRMFDPDAQVWLYKCPECKAEYVAKRDPIVAAPVVAEITPIEEDPTPIGGRVVVSYDILAGVDHIAITGAGGRQAGEVLGLQRADEE